ncbi:MAG TPA: DUF5615 family PIN-like protein, partial [Pyrinomonadaceae bacterium]|nr:DUF5615 family PIN-like protein [Pyrinomonadaceae bacterium]
MRVLLDECLPKKLKAHIVADLVQTVPEAGWAGTQNGELLRLAEQEFDVLITNDQNIEHQQVISRFGIAFVVLIAPTNDIVDLLPLVSDLNRVLPLVKA